MASMATPPAHGSPQPLQALGPVCLLPRPVPAAPAPEIPLKTWRLCCVVIPSIEFKFSSKHLIRQHLRRTGQLLKMASLKSICVFIINKTS